MAFSLILLILSITLHYALWSLTKKLLVNDKIKASCSTNTLPKHYAVLLDKLSNLGILDKEHGWFMDYLSNRTQVVEFQGVASASEAVSTGVPQGSILGPLLFILHINDLPEVVSDCNILMYADDTVLYCSSSQASVIQDKLNAELSKIDHWLAVDT